jgi:hypothetical protein
VEVCGKNEEICNFSVFWGYFASQGFSEIFPDGLVKF